MIDYFALWYIPKGFIYLKINPFEYIKFFKGRAYLLFSMGQWSNGMRIRS